MNRQSFHQDFPYEPHSVARLAGAITYLDSTGPGTDAGSTEVIVGSHLCGEWPTVMRPRHMAAFQGVGSEAYSIPEQLLASSGLERRKIDAHAGDLLLIHVLVVHKAGNNATALCRHAVINEYVLRYDCYNCF